MTRIYTPVEGHTGVIAGVPFTEGQADVDQLTPSQLRYFRSQGYGIDQPPTVVTPAPPLEHPGKVHVGTPLADAAQDGHRVTVLVDGAVAYDERHDTDAVSLVVSQHEGGPIVTARRLHTGGLMSGAPGDEVQRLLHAGEDVLSRSDPPADPAKRPNVRDSINAWRTWALTLPGADPDDIAAKTKPELQALGNPEET